MATFAADLAFLAPAFLATFFATTFFLTGAFLALLADLDFVTFLALLGMVGILPSRGPKRKSARPECPVGSESPVSSTRLISRPHHPEAAL